jgi:hypothetical protein
MVCNYLIYPAERGNLTFGLIHKISNKNENVIILIWLLFLALFQTNFAMTQHAVSAASF